MTIAVYGSLGIAQHVLEAARERGISVTAVVDSDQRRHGQSLCGYTVEPLERLRAVAFDGIVIATFDWRTAIDALWGIGCTQDDLYDGVFWEPFFMQIEPTTMCTYTCPSCSRHTLPKGRKNRNMPLGDFERLLDSYPHVKRLQLQGLGEPTINPELIEMLRVSKLRGISTSITTNAYALRRDIERGLLDHLDKLIISIDTQGQRDVRQHYLSDISSALSRITDRRPKVVFNFVVSHENIDELESVYDFVVQASPDQLHIQFLENWYVPGQEGFDQMAAYVAQSQGIEGEIIKRIHLHAANLQRAGTTLTYTGSQERRGVCWWPFFGCFVSCDGYVTPCCIRMHPEVFNLGNVLEEDFNSIWNSDIYSSFRKNMFTEHGTNVCTFCPR